MRGLLPGRTVQPPAIPTTDRQLVISQEEIARLCGLSRQNVNREPNKLADAGLLDVCYGVIKVIHLDGLQRFPRGEP